MIRLSGDEAVNQAYYADNNAGVLANSNIFIEKNGEKIPVFPDRALEMLKSGETYPKDLTCEVLSVWDMLLLAEKKGTLFVHPCPNTVLVFTRDYGAELGSGIRGIAIRLPVFEAATSWAMQSPVIDLDYDRDEFVVKLYPRMLLRKKAWQQDVDLLRYSKEIANALIRIFALDYGAIWKTLRRDTYPKYEGEPLVHGGHLLDVVLEDVRTTIEQGPGKKAVLKETV